jgi:hypothetical protein
VGKLLCVWEMEDNEKDVEGENGIRKKNTDTQEIQS